MKRTTMKGPEPAVGKVMKRLHYPFEVILVCVRWYVAFPLSLRNLERGSAVDHSTVHRWAINLLPVLEKAIRRCERAVGKSWQMDEIYVKARDEWRYLYQAVDKEGNTVDSLLRARRNKAVPGATLKSQLIRTVPRRR
jgi:putative transposase